MHNWLGFYLIYLNYFQSRISLIQDEISSVGSDLEALKVIKHVS